MTKFAVLAALGVVSAQQQHGDHTHEEHPAHQEPTYYTIFDVIADEEPAVDFVLNMAKDGDLVVITADDLQRTWKQIINLNSDKPKGKKTIPGTKVYLPETEKRYVLDQDEALIIDERGVRLASSESEDSD